MSVDMKLQQTRREISILRRMAELERDPELLGRLMREGTSWWLDTDRCTRTARMLLLKGLIKEADQSDNCAYADLSPWGRMALADAGFVSPFTYIALGIALPHEAKQLMNSARGNSAT